MTTTALGLDLLVVTPASAAITTKSGSTEASTSSAILGRTIFTPVIDGVVVSWDPTIASTESATAAIASLSSTVAAWTAAIMTQIKILTELVADVMAKLSTN